ncbi:iron-sulfur subunit of ubiquinol-cytochrome c reductase [Ostreococcus tauri]|uniref:Cytochrome b-c1 complex subunit Rieske, mitochondrial n=1 Tax=Ostreococcus tauri TaxID=70448 RepID=A0A1Y5I8K2_OSTTA|nr:iron-sulfur subunit of ubiquinol-cytochrome c reductase [Ostreococcus tauri]
MRISGSIFMSDSVPTEVERRDFIFIATTAAAAIGTGLAAWPLVDQMNPASDTRASSSLDVDVSKIPVAEIAAANAVNFDRLPDPETDDARLRPRRDGTLNPAILITSGVCTHLGCVPVGPNQGAVGDYGGWYCPCHGSHYDISGRIRKGPAPLNLPVPDYVYLTDDLVTISI